MKSTKWAAPMAVLASFIHVASRPSPRSTPGCVSSARTSRASSTSAARRFPPMTPSPAAVSSSMPGRRRSTSWISAIHQSRPGSAASTSSPTWRHARWARANSVDARFGILAVAVEADPKQDDGWVAFYSTLTLELLAVVPAGALPDMVTFSENGRYVLAANEGEPDPSYTNDPEGTVTIIDLQRFGQPGFHEDRRASAPSTSAGRAHEELPADMRIYGPGATRRPGLRARVHHDRRRDRLGHAAGEQRHRRHRHPNRPRKEGLRTRLQGPLEGGQQARRERRRRRDPHPPLAGVRDVPAGRDRAVPQRRRAVT